MIHRLLLCALLLLTFCGSNWDNDLEKQLYSIDRQRRDFELIDKKCTALLKQYDNPAVQGRIYYAWANADFQSGIRRPEKLVSLAKKALKSHEDPSERIQLYICLGNAMERCHAGVRGNDLVKIRPKVVVPYLEGIEEAVAKIAYVKDALGVYPDIEGPKLPSEIALESELKDLVFLKSECERAVAHVYSRMPFATEEIMTLASKKITDERSLMSLKITVENAVAGREERFRKQQGKNNQTPQRCE